MISETLIEKLSKSLKAPLLPTDTLRYIARSRTRREASLTELFAVVDDVHFIKNAYAKLFGREPEPGAITGWLKVLRSGKLTRAQLLEHFVDSEEGKLNGVRVAGLAFIVALEQHDRTVNRRRLRLFSSSTSLEFISFANAISIEIKNVETQVCELAQACVDVIGHIDDRLKQDGVSPLTLHQPQKTISTPIAVQIDDQVNLLHNKIAVLYSESSESDGDQRRTRLVSQVIDRNRDIQGPLNCLLIGDETIGLLRTLQAKHVNVFGVHACTAEVGFLRSQGWQASDEAIDVWLTTFPDHSASVVWIQATYQSSTDEVMMASMNEICRVLDHRGLVVIDIPKDRASFVTKRIIAAAEVAGLQHTNSFTNGGFDDTAFQEVGTTFILCKQVESAHEGGNDV